MNLRQSSKAILAASLLGVMLEPALHPLFKEPRTRPNDPEILKAAELKRQRKRERNLREIKK